MSVFRRDKKSVWLYELWLLGQRIHTSTGSTSKTLAVRAGAPMSARFGANHLKPDTKPLLFSIAAKNCLKENKPN